MIYTDAMHTLLTQIYDENKQAFDNFKCNYHCLANCCNDSVYLPEELLDKHKIDNRRGDIYININNGKSTRAPELYKFVETSNGRCIFLDNKYKCSIYSERPLVCRVYPIMIDKSCSVSRKFIKEINLSVDILTNMIKIIGESQQIQIL